MNARVAGALLLALVCAWPAAGVPAFPGAEGYGAATVGGRGGSVYHVTNLNDSGAGSLRTGVSVGHRTIVFDVSGTIDLLTDLKITQPFLTIAGQTAPGDGIALKRRLTSIQNTHDVVIRYLRCRPGDADCPNFQDDAFHCVNVTNVVADHVSASWSIDECLSVTWSTNVSVQWCFIAEGLSNSCHVKGPHGYGSLIRYGNGGITYHHNLYAHNSSRNPRLGDNIQLDFINNVIYDWGFYAGYNADDAADNPAGYTNRLNYIANLLKTGSSTRQNPPRAFVSGVTNNWHAWIYQSGNLLNGADAGWNAFTGPYTALGTRISSPSVSTDTAAAACERVLASAGASAARDDADVRVANDVRNRTGSNIDSENQVGGWPVLNSLPAPADGDGDGMPDYWELAMGLNLSVPNNNHTNASGYTDLEDYLNWLAGPHAVGNRNGSLAIDLRQLNGRSGTNLAFSVLPGTNGTASLLPDGVTAQFVPDPNFSGLASFSFLATNGVSRAGFGPVTVAVLVTVTNSPNTPPVLLPIANQTAVAGVELQVTNSASDSDLPAQVLTFSLLNPPAGASIDSGSGLFRWRPTMSQAGSNYLARVLVTDNGMPSASATQSFTITVTSPPQPVAQVDLADARFRLTVSDAIAGPDYILQTSTNLMDWTELWTTNPTASPFIWIDPDTTNSPARFYRIQLGP